MSSKPLFIVSMLLLCLVSRPALSYYDFDATCEDDQVDVHVIQDLNRSNCDINSATYCECLSQSTDKNVLLSALKDKNQYEEQIQLQRLKQKYRLRMLNVYSQMNYGTNIQEQIFGIKREGRENKCTYNDVKKYMDEAIRKERLKASKPPEVDAANTDQILEAEKKPLYHCSKSNDCAEVIKKVNQTYEMHKSTWNHKTCEDQIKFRDIYEADLSQEEKQEQKKNEADLVKEIASFHKKYPSITSPDTLLVVANLLKGEIPSPADYCRIKAEYNFKSSFDKIDAKKAESKVETIKERLVDREQAIDKQIKEDYSKLPDYESCVTYQDYQAIIATPTPEFLKTIASSGSKDIFDPQNIRSRSDDRLKFLQRNPMIAVLATNKGSRDDVTNELKAFANEHKNSSAETIQRAYVAFMQKKIGPLRDRHNVSQVAQCETLGVNLGRIEEANSLPPLEMKVEDGSPDSISNNLLACYSQDKNKNGKSFFKDVDESPLYMLLSEVGPSSLNTDNIFLGPKNDNDYKEFNKKECADKGWAEFRANYMEKHCTGFLKFKKTCSGKHLLEKKTKMRELLEKFYAEKNPEFLKKYLISKELNYRPRAKRAREAMAESNQDTKVKEYYNNVVRPKLNQSISNTGSDSSGGTSQASNDQILADAQVQYDQASGQDVGRGPASVAEGATSGDNSKSDNVSQPEWVKEMPNSGSQASVEAINNAKDVEDLMSKDPNISWEDRADERENIRQQIEETRKKLSSMNSQQREEIEKKLDDFEDKLDEAEQRDLAEMSKPGVKRQDVPPPAYAAQQYGATPQAFAQQMALGGGAFGGMASGGGGGGAGVSKNKTAKDYNEAVLSMYKDRKEVITPSGLVLQDIPANPDTLTLALKTEFRGALEPSKAEYKDIFKSQESLADYLFKKLPQPYKEGVIQINDPEKDPAKRKKPMYVQILKDNGKFTARIFPRKYKREFIEKTFSAN